MRGTEIVAINFGRTPVITAHRGMCEKMLTFVTFFIINKGRITLFTRFWWQIRAICNIKSTRARYDETRNGNAYIFVSIRMLFIITFINEIKKMVCMYNELAAMLTSHWHQNILKLFSEPSLYSWDANKTDLLLKTTLFHVWLGFDGTFINNKVLICYLHYN